ncbi:MAG TPA: type I-E CRISPR-associated protein Cas7/Cse4/CasC [Candidatus Binataceae bacterium]|nr:type I-E CRISPR-associated protein Cas7/Cse4/CasC [Candidatus Binataceae bacterium]
MASHRFIQIHSLTSYPAALLNRDDAGLAKRIPFGGATRTRISSQCLKRHWRTADDAEALRNCADGQTSVRSRLSFDRHVYRPLVEEDRLDHALAHAVTEAVMALTLGESAKAKAEKKKLAEDGDAAAPGVQSNQVTVLGRPELDFLRAEARTICGLVRDSKGAADAVKKHFTRDRIDNLRALKLGAGLDAAMFGRMVTGDILARVDAAIHVAHAFTVHGEQSESDYFSAVDDILKDSPEGGLGSGHINSSELTSGLFYGYVAIDLHGLIRNLGDDRALAAEVTRRMIHLIATVTPGAKLGSTAPHAYADLMMVEAASAQPRTLANAFLTPVRLAPDPLVNAYDALAAHLGQLDRFYDRTARNAIALGQAERLKPVLNDSERASSLAELARWAATRVEDSE